MARRKRSKKWISWLVILILLIVAIGICAKVYKEYFGDEKKEGTESQIETEDEAREDEELLEEEPKGEEKIEKGEVLQYDGEDPNDSEFITGAITHTGVSGDYLIVRINLDQYLSEGKCSLRVKEYGAEIYEASAKLVNSASTTTCEGFDVPIVMIGGGNFEIIIDVEADGKSGTITGEASV